MGQPTIFFFVIVSPQDRESTLSVPFGTGIVFEMLLCEQDISTLKFSNHSQNWPWLKNNCLSRLAFTKTFHWTFQKEKQGRKVMPVEFIHSRAQIEMSILTNGLVTFLFRVGGLM